MAPIMKRGSWSALFGNLNLMIDAVMIGAG